MVLVFGEQDASKISSVRVVGEDDNLDAYYIINVENNCFCIAMIELSNEQSAFLQSAINKESRLILESVFDAIAWLALGLRKG